MERADRAVEIKHSKNNCCQAVLLAFADELGMTEEQLRQLGSPFGLGMGAMEGTCGALVGAEMVLGLARSDGGQMRRDASELLNRFVERCGAERCADLKGRDTGVILCPCDDCVRNATIEVERLLAEESED